jgi:transposase
MRPQGTKQQLEVRRRVAVALFQSGWGVRQVARHIGCSHSSVRRWRDAFNQQADAGLNAKPHPGSRPKLTVEQQQGLADLLAQGARAHGYRTELWTLHRIAQLIEQYFGITYCPSGVWHLLRRMGWSPQKPERRARERDEDAIADWRKHEWPRLKKSPA